MSNTIDLNVAGRLATVTLARPKFRNAFDTEMLKDFEQAVHELSRSRNIDLVVLRGQGDVFCAGTDLKELAQLNASDTLHWQRRTSELVEHWARLDAITLTVFNGPAIGSGAILGLASDLRIAADSTWFSFPELGFGIPLTWSGIPVLVRLLGPDRTQRVLLMQERLDATQLLELQLVMQVAPGEALDALADGLAQQLLATPSLGMRMTKRAVHAAAPPAFAACAMDPFIAAYSVLERGEQGFAVGKTQGEP